MKKYIVIIAIVLVGMFIVAQLVRQQVSQQIENAFEKVDGSIEKSNQIISKSIDEQRAEYLSQLDSLDSVKVQNLVLAQDNVIRFTDSLILNLQSNCPSEDNVDWVNRIMIKDKNGELLKLKFKKLREECNQLLVQNKEVDSFYEDIETLSTNELFKDIPCVAGVTMLHKFQNDSKQAVNYILDKWSRRRG